MLVKAIREFQHGAVRAKAGGLLDVNDYEGAELVRTGLAEDVQGAASKGKRSPISSARASSRDGGEAAASSSRQARVRRPRLSLPSKEPTLV